MTCICIQVEPPEIFLSPGLNHIVTSKVTKVCKLILSSITVTFLHIM